jgi:signal transduction histidine kinase
LLSNIYQDLKQFEKSIKLLEDAIKIVKKRKIPNARNKCLIAACLNNIGNAYREQRKFNKAIYFFKLALEDKIVIKNNPVLYAILINNLSYCYLKTKEVNKLPSDFYKAKKIFDSLGVKDESAMCDIYLSNYYIRKNDSTKANLHAESALKLAKDSKASYYYLTALSHAGSINPKKASKYIKDYHRINDSLLFVERNARNQYYKIQLETDEISQEKETALKQRSLVLAIAFTLLFISVLIIIIARQRIKQKELRLKQSQQKANEELYQLLLNQKDSEEKARYLEKKRIAMELHDGVMNKLTSTRLNLSVLSIKKDEATIERCLGYIKEINLVENEIRNITHDLNREAFHSSNSFSKLLEDFVEEQNGISNTYFIVEVDSYIDWNIISNITKMNLYRIIQETVHNINKHAKAQKGIINLIMDRKNICLSVIDDGVGIELSTNEQGIGLKNIEHRVKQLKGKLNIHTKSNSGTSINISLPLEKAD